MSASTKLPKYFDQVPQSARVWTALALTANVYNSSVYDFTAFKSASKMAQKQFLLLRTVMTTQERLNPEQFGFQEKCEQAMRIIDSSDDFQGYLKDTEEGKNERRNIFYLLKKQQLEVLGQALSKKVGMRFHDEVIVNSTFMTLLVGISDLSKNCEFAWISSRVTLAADFSRGEEAKEDRKYSAITDGQLQHLSTHGIKVLVECKRYSRSKCPYKVDMQEAAQMVAWIKEHPGPERQRVLVSQDDKEIYITFAQYDDKWLNYINGTTDSLSLMCMYRFGPFYIDKWEDLRDAAIIILAITL